MQTLVAERFQCVCPAGLHKGARAKIRTNFSLWIKPESDGRGGETPETRQVKKYSVNVCAS
jgi:hypothetical protein